MLTYLCETTPWVKQIVAITHHAKAFYMQFILDRAEILKWRPEIIMKCPKNMCMNVEHMKFIDSISLPFPIRKLAGAFGLSASKSWYPHYFNTKNINYLGPIPDITYYDADQINTSERTEFLEWYNGQKEEIFVNKRVLEEYCQDEITVLRQACQVFRQKFMAIGNIEVFSESLTIRRPVTECCENGS
jgi:hypothetical protein